MKNSSKNNFYGKNTKQYKKNSNSNFNNDTKKSSNKNNKVENL